MIYQYDIQKEAIMLKVAVMMGSKNDYEVLKDCVKTIKEFGVSVEVRVISAHRTPDKAHDFAVNAEKNGFGTIICAAGKSAHLAGVVAAYTTLPVIALPIQTSFMGGLDSLLSMVQMPEGIPCATVGVNAAKNAGLLAVQILSLNDASLKAKLKEFKASMAKKIDDDDKFIISEVNK